MSKPLQFYQDSETEIYPEELLRRYRSRAGLSQERLAGLMGLASGRVIQSWEGGFTLPKPARLKKLIEIFYKQKAFLAGQELVEAQRLWLSVKKFYEAHSEKLLSYPYFDTAWFSEKVLFAEKGNISAVPVPLPVSVGSKLLNLLPPYPLIGRDAELIEITSLLQSGEIRLLTLTGTGGSGKTRLALEIGSHFEVDTTKYYRDGVYFAALETINTPFLLIQQLASILEITQTDSTSLLKKIKAFLSGKELLLILDNFEQLLPAAPLLLELLHSASRFQILVTSREALKIFGEREYRVVPLTPPTFSGNENEVIDLDALVANPAVAFFSQQAVIANQDFKLTQENVGVVVKVCQELDGLPLAIELAAARSNLLSPLQILTRLKKRFSLLSNSSPTFSARHRTLHAALEWSFELLAPYEKRMFASLAVFAGSFSVEAVESISNSETSEILDGLGSLLNKNLIYRVRNSEGFVRFQLLQTIREYALEKLADIDNIERANYYTRFEKFYLELVENLEPHLRSDAQKGVFDTFEKEYFNIREVISRALLKEDATTALRLGGSLWYFWWVRGFLSEGRPLLEQALALPLAEPATRAKALNAAGNLADIHGDTVLALEYFSKSLELYTELGDLRGMGNVCNNIGNVYSLIGEYPAAKLSLQRGLELRNQAGDQNAVAGSLNNLGRLARIMGDQSECLSYYKAALAIVSQLKDAGTMAQVLSNLANLTLNTGDLMSARQYAQESYDLAQQTDNKAMLIFSLLSLGRVAFEQQDYSGSLEHYKNSLKISQQLDERLQIANSLDGSGRVLVELAQYSKATECLSKSMEIFEAMGTHQGTLIGLLSQAGLAARQGQSEAAAALLGKIDRLQLEWQTVLEPIDQHYYQRIKDLCLNSKEVGKD